MEEEHVKEAVNLCDYPDWYIWKIKNRMECSKLKKAIWKEHVTKGRKPIRILWLSPHVQRVSEAIA